MKQLFSVLCLWVLLAGGICCVYTMQTRQLYQEELELAVETAMRHSLEEARIRKSYTIGDDQELYADFLGELFLLLNSKADYTVTVYRLDLKEGVMDIEVTADFSLPGGGSAQATCRKYAVVTET